MAKDKDKNKYEEQLQTLVPISSLAQQYQKEIINQSKIIEYRRGKYIFRRGDEDNFNYYLLKGELEMTSDGRYVNRFVGGTDAARFALAQLRPRQLSAQTKSAVTMFQVDRELMDKFLTLEEREEETSGEMEVSEIDEGESGDWMTNMLQSELFARIPAVNIQRIFALMEPVEVAEGEVVIRQGEPGDYYYVLEKGRCDVSVRPASGSHAVKVATLRDGDSFGEEALVSNAKRNATITMATDGQLMRLTKDNFIELIKKPALQSVTDKQGEKMVAEGAVWMDVRFPEEIRESGIAGSMNMPLNILRVRADTLDREKTYIACCDSGLRSSVAAFLLMQRGFTAHFLTGGLMRGPVEKKPEAAPPPAPEKQARKQKATAEPAEGKKAPQVESEKPERKPLREAEVEQGGEALAADVRLSSLKAELAKANLRVDEALKLNKAAEAAKQAVEKTAANQLKHERDKLKTEADRAQKALKEARRLKDEVEKTRQKAEAETKHRQREETAKLTKLKHQSEQWLRKEKQQLEAKHAQDAKEITHIQQQMKKLEKQLEAEHARDAKEITRIKQQKKDLEKQLEAKQAHDANEITRIKHQKEELEKQLEAKHAREVEEIARIKQQKDQLETDSLAVQQRLEEALAQRQAAEEARHKVEKEAEDMLAKQRSKLEKEANSASMALEETERLKQEIETAKLAAEKEASQRRREEEERITKIEEETARRLREEDSRMKEEYANNAEILDKIRRLKEEAEKELQEERDRFKQELAAAKNKLKEAHQTKDEVIRSRQIIEEEAGQRNRQIAEVENKLRNDSEKKLKEERRKLEAEFANNAEGLERVLAEKAAADAARLAAEQEAERIIAEYKAEYATRQREDEERLRTQHEELEAKTQWVRQALEEARQAKNDAEAARLAAEEGMALLRKEQEQPVQERDSSGQEQEFVVPTEEQLRAEIAAMEAEIKQASTGLATVQSAKKPDQGYELIEDFDKEPAEPAMPEDSAARVIDPAQLKAIMAQKRQVEEQRIMQKASAARQAAKNSRG